MNNPALSLLVGSLALLTTACASRESEPAGPAPVAITTNRLEPFRCGDIARMHTLGGVFVSSQPDERDFARLEESGIKTVLNLRVESENANFDERAVVTGLGLAYVNVPFGGPSQLSDEVFAQAREHLNGAERPILMHCASANRAGAIWIAWRVLDGGATLEAAVAEAKTIGLKSSELEARARDYVARHAK